MAELEDAIMRQRHFESPDGLTFHICNTQPSMTAVLRAVKRAEHGLFNCLASIAHDGQFVRDVVHACSPWPLIANLRCGLWYAPPAADSCYFKSTDGHSGQWSFSTARMNLHAALTAAAQGGVCIVDATRRGKTFPDALSKTVPIWAAVLNRAVARLRELDAASDWQTDIHLPSFISGNERIQIRQRLDGWVDDLLAVGADHLSPLVEALQRPLRCFWACQDGQDDWEMAVEERQSLFTPVVLISASIPHSRGRRRFVLDDDLEEESGAVGTAGHPSPIDIMFDYVPGAGDDEESWAQGVTPELAWANLRELLAAGPDGVEAVAKRVVKDGKRAKAQRRTGAGARGGASSGWTKEPAWVAGAMALGTLPALTGTTAWKDCAAVLNVGSSQPAWLDGEPPTKVDFHASPAGQVSILAAGNNGCDVGRYLWLPVGEDRAPKTAVLRALPAAVAFLSFHLEAGRKVMIVAEPEAMDIAATVLLACLIACYALDGDGGAVWADGCKMFAADSGNEGCTFQPALGTATFSRVTVRQYLAVVAAHYPPVVLSKALLRQAFNAFLPLSGCGQREGLKNTEIRRLN